MKLDFVSKNQAVHSLVLNGILRGDFKPGERLVIDALAASLSVSQIPIREALRQLEADGFVTFEPHVGFTVTPIHADLIGEVFAMLEAAEVFCGRKACEHLTDEQFAQLEHMLREMDRSADDPARWSQDNKRLHQFICEASHSPLMTITMKKALDHWDRLQMHYFRDVLSNRIKIAQADHWLMLAALRKRDPEAVERIIRQHNRAALAAYLKHLDRVALVTDSAV